MRSKRSATDDFKVRRAGRMVMLPAFNRSPKGQTWVRFLRAASGSEAFMVMQ